MKQTTTKRSGYSIPVVLVLALVLLVTTLVDLSHAAEPVSPTESGSTYAFAEPPYPGQAGSCLPGYVQIDPAVGVDWTIEGEPVTVSDDAPSRFYYSGGFQGEVRATAEPGYFINSAAQSVFYLTVNPCRSQPRATVSTTSEQVDTKTERCYPHKHRARKGHAHKHRR